MNTNSIIEELESYIYDHQYYLEKKKDVETLKVELDKLIRKIHDMKAKCYDTSATESQIEEINKSLQIEENRILKIAKNQELIETKIENMTQPYKNILFLKYLKGYSFDQIASKMNYSSKRIYQLHKDAIKIYCERNTSLLISSN